MLCCVHGRGLDAKTVSVSEKKNGLSLTLGRLARLNPLTPPVGLPESAQETQRTSLGVCTIMFSHDLLDGLGGFVCVVEGDGADVVVEDVGFDDAVEKLAADETEFTVDGSGGATGEVPGFGLVVGEGWIGVLEEGDGN